VAQVEQLGHPQIQGLAAPVVISNATEEYRSEMDVLGNFIKERCLQTPGVSVRARELFRAYQEWCDENNERACSEQFLFAGP
jgi:putative DNA primase/helicase